jgi:hypothetical protein
MYCCSRILLAAFVSVMAFKTFARSKVDVVVCEHVKAQLKEGDLIFLDVPNFVFKHVAETAGGVTSHVGVAMLDNNGEWIVAESKIPKSTMTPVCKFLARTDKGRFAVNRLSEGLSEDQVAGIKLAAKSKMGILYDTGFNFESKRQFCSKFVHVVYAQGAGIQVGYFESFRELLAGLESSPHRDSNLKFWKRWFMGSIPWERITITPHSEYTDSRFFSVIDTF